MAEIPKNQGLNLTRYVYRLTYEKKGRAKLISHLDLMRAMQRAFKRAKLPIWYTQGFNPHPYIMFPLALSLGTESSIEPMDIALLSEMSFEDIRESVNAVLPEGLRIVSVAAPVCEHTDIYKSDYEIRIQTDKSPEETEKLFKEFVSCDEILIKKRVKPKKNRKEGFKDVDVKQYLELFGSSYNKSETVLELRLATSAGNDFNLNFMPVLEAFSEKCGVEIAHISAKRTKILCKSGENFT